MIEAVAQGSTRRLSMWTGYRERVAAKRRTETHGKLFLCIDDEHRIATAFQGRAEKPFANYSFRTQEQMDRWIFEIKAYFVAVERQETLRRSVAPTVAVGDILVRTWGYEQTNVDFYEVTRVLPKSVAMRPIGSDVTETGFMAGYAVPRPGAFTGPETRRGAAWANSRKWSGQPVYCSWYA